MTSTTPKQNPRQILPTEQLPSLNERSNFKGMLQFLGHVTVIGCGGYLWATQREHLWIAIPALVVYGFALATMFAAVHECAHRTAFASNSLNDVMGWVAGVFSFYNAAFYRRYHKWHHRYTQIPGKDPELEDPKPTTLWEYCWQVSGLPWWRGKVVGHWRVVTGDFANMPYIPETTRDTVRWATGLQLSVYAIAIVFSVMAQQPWFLLYWVLPLAVGQPFLRMILFAEHMGCAHDDNPLANTRTTLTTWPINFLMWNMPFHAEHHLYPSIPFHQLPAAHSYLGPEFAYVDPGYVSVNRAIVAKLTQAAS
ncbi:MAG: fatty acid desaturase family protein [Cyanobacteria bacterium J06559_3]